LNDILVNRNRVKIEDEPAENREKFQLEEEVSKISHDKQDVIHNVSRLEEDNTVQYIIVMVS